MVSLRMSSVPPDLWHTLWHSRCGRVRVVRSISGLEFAAIARDSGGWKVLGRFDRRAAAVMRCRRMLAESN